MEIVQRPHCKCVLLLLPSRQQVLKLDPLAEHYACASQVLLPLYGNACVASSKLHSCHHPN